MSMVSKNLASKRMADFRRILRDAQLDGFLTVDPLEQQYLCGVEVSRGEAVFLVTPKTAYCMTKKMMVGKMKTAGSFLKVQDVPYGGMLDGALSKVKELGLKRVAFVPECVTFEEGEKMSAAGFVRSLSLVGEMRQQKYEDELTKLRKSCKIAYESFLEVKPKIKTGVTEEDVRIWLTLAMYKRGADGVPFNIVSFGENAADPHHTPSRTRKLRSEDAVLLDFGCQYEGYTSDMTRSWWHGKKEPAEYTKIWNIVHNAYKAGVKSLRPGVTSGGVDSAARRVIEEAGYGKEFFHTTGHGIGLYEHEMPILRANTPHVLAENYVVTVEPGIYLENKWGIRLEDTFLVTKTGSKKLTQK